MYIEISIQHQTLTVWGCDQSNPYGGVFVGAQFIAPEMNELDKSTPYRQYAVSTAKNGIGCEKGSGCTPLGNHIVRAKIGAGAPANAVFVGRRATGEIWSPELAIQHPERDWILTRILWLSGTEVGKNRLGNVDSMQRYIYIHGTPDSESIGQPCSHGCVRMRNADIVELFDLVDVGTPVVILDDIGFD